MHVLGVIAEYNPFHFGHSYHLQQAEQKCSPEAVVCVMSGNFVQRGEPAIADKWARAEMALRQGVDLVLELPVLYATRSAYWFARGGVETLMRTGIVTHISFGVETEDFDLLILTAKKLAAETPAYQKELKKALKEGLSFPRARAHALYGQSSQALLQSPNNVLALTYLQVLYEKQWPLIPVPVARKGAGYSETKLNPGILPSATSIRELLASNPGTISPEMRHYLPSSTSEVLEREYRIGRSPVFKESLDPQLMTLLRRCSKESFQQIVDVSEGLENRLWRMSRESKNTKEFLACLKTKRYTLTRLQRLLIHLLLDYTREKEKHLDSGPPYLRVLGFTAKGKELLRRIKKASSLPVITKAAHSKKHDNAGEHYTTCWQMDILATDLYSLLYPAVDNRKGSLDYLRGPVTLDIPPVHAPTRL